MAIIGGFLVSRVIAIASEQAGVQRKMREINNEIQTKVGYGDIILEYLHNIDISNFIEDRNVIRGLLEGKSLEEIFKEQKTKSVSIAQLRPHFEQLEEILEEILDAKETTLADLKEKQPLKHPKKERWYTLVLAGIDAMAYESPVTSLLAGGMNIPTPKIDKEYQEKEKMVSQFETELTILSAQKEEQKRILEDFGKPKYVTSGLIVLAYAAAVGIIYPSILLPYPKDTYDDHLTKWWILGLFFSHIVAIFGYLFMAMRGLSRTLKDQKET